MIDLAAATSRLAHICSGGGQNGRLPRVAAICAALAAIAVLVAAAWHPPLAHADGGASARNKASASASDDGGESAHIQAAAATPQAYTRRILRALFDDDTNNWVRYWQARAACDAAAAHDAPAPPRARALLALTAPICAQLDALLGVNPADHPPRGDERAGGLTLSEPGAAAGYTLFSVLDTQNVYLIDALGRVAHTWHIGDNVPDIKIFDAKLLDNGNLVVIAHIPDKMWEIDPRGNIVWQYDTHPTHHDVLKMPNGNMLLLVRGNKTREEVIAAGGNPEFVHEKGLKYDYLLEARPTGASGGEIVWEWSPWDHLVQDFDPTKPNYGVVAEHPELIDINFLLESRSENLVRDWMHANAIDYNPELDQIMLSPRHFSELWIIDHSVTAEEARGHIGGNSGMGGDLLYRWGNPRAYGHGTSDDQRLFWQHQTYWIPPGLPGAGRILVFNNGEEIPGYERFYSSIDEIAPPVDGYGYRRADGAAYPPDRLAWTYAAETPVDFYAPIMSGAQRLPNGNTLIVDGPAGGIFQVTPDGKAVWKYIAPRHYHISPWQDSGAAARLTYGTPDKPPESVIKKFVYRAYWYPPNHPGLQALDLTPGAYIEDLPDIYGRAYGIVTALTAGDFGEPIADSDFDIYLDEDNRRLIYIKRPCAPEDARAKFFLHIMPSDMRVLPDYRHEHGFDNFDFNIDGSEVQASDNWCLAMRRLPRYPIERIRTGQYVSGEGQLWRADVELGE